MSAGTPWKLTGMGRIVDANGSPIWFSTDEGSTQTDWDQLELIVKAVNAHDGLVEAMKDSLRDAESGEKDRLPVIANQLRAALEAIRP